MPDELVVILGAETIILACVAAMTPYAKRMDERTVARAIDGLAYGQQAIRHGRSAESRAIYCD
ncbi:hypothetical protein XH94_17295 [Bradyrhizobium zhanjiangense]|uniref:Uncharacterized protein n=1 Tax=Bradyrhizobium zhanjiangense TaxID=1325107 RepID=A0A4Q0SKB4_9BRAD|nr:hypothetical protein XH94_17295 [Bradyrhizobium zhanjiangense]